MGWYDESVGFTNSAAAVRHATGQMRSLNAINRAREQKKAHIYFACGEWKCAFPSGLTNVCGVTPKHAYYIGPYHPN